MKPTKKLPLFIITGASGVGKSTICNILFQNEIDYIVFESDLLWNNIYNTPEDDYRKYRETQLRVCANISQIGLPVVLCAGGIPKQFETCRQRNFFTNIHYLALVCDNSLLEERMRTGRKITDENWIKSSVDFNNWLKENADKNEPPIKLLDITKFSPENAAKTVDEWIKNILY